MIFTACSSGKTVHSKHIVCHSSEAKKKLKSAKRANEVFG